MTTSKSKLLIIFKFSTISKVCISHGTICVIDKMLCHTIYVLGNYMHVVLSYKNKIKFFVIIMCLQFGQSCYGLSSWPSELCRIF